MFDSRDHISFRNERYTSIDKTNPRLLGLSTIEINPTELCNRTCSFCPRHNPTVYPNRNLNMTVETAELLVSQLQEVEYTGDIHITGFGEPTLNPKIVSLIEIFSRNFYTEMITNGDRLLNGYYSVSQFTNAGLSNLIIDCYDDKAQYEQVCSLMQDCKISYRIREHYDTGEEKIIELYNFTNRAGLMNKQTNSNPCYLPFYKVFLDWNGDVRICCNDWARNQESLGNIHERDFADIWMSKKFIDIRKKLSKGDRNKLEACKACNINGIQQGKDSVDIWQNLL